VKEEEEDESDEEAKVAANGNGDVHMEDSADEPAGAATNSDEEASTAVGKQSGALFFHPNLHANTFYSNSPQFFTQCLDLFAALPLRQRSPSV